MIAIVDLQWFFIWFINLEERDAQNLKEKTHDVQRKVQKCGFSRPGRQRRNMFGLYENIEIYILDTVPSTFSNRKLLFQRANICPGWIWAENQKEAPTFVRKSILAHLSK